MKGLKSKMTRGVQTGTLLKIADNSGAKTAAIIGVLKYKGVKKRHPTAGIGDIVCCAVKSGNPDMKHQKIHCVVIRMRRAFRRKNGLRVKFEDNAGIVLKDLEKGEPKGTVIKGPVAREAVDRFSLLGKIASIVV